MRKILKFIFGTEKILGIIPGLLLSAFIAVISYFACDGLILIIKMEHSPISAVTFAIIIGILFRNIIGINKIFNGGIDFGVKKLLRLGIILMGIRMSILDVAKVGILSVFIVIICITTGLLITTLITRRLKLEDRLGTLIAVGTGICGVSAISATAPAIGAEDEETAYAIGTISIFGAIAMLSYPYITHILLGLSDIQSGIFLGTAIHDTSQVTGASMIYDQLWLKEKSLSPTTMDIAIVTKLVRNTFIAIVIPLMAYLYAKKSNSAKITKVKIFTFIPLFVICFVFLAVFRTIGDYLIINREFFGNAQSWANSQKFIQTWSGYFLAVAMAGVGLGIDIKKLAKLGYKPFLVGLFSALTVGVVSFLLVRLFVASIF